MKCLFLMLVFSVTTLAQSGKAGIDYDEDASPLAPMTFQRVGDAFLNVGYTPSLKTTFGIGIRWKWIGMEFGGNFKEDKMPDHEYFDIPHSDYKTIQYKQATSWINLSGGYDVTTWFYPYVKGGVAWQRDSILARSNVTGLYYAHGAAEATFTGVYGAGALFYPLRNVIVGAGWSNIQGAFFTIGYSWTNKDEKKTVTGKKQ